MYTTKNIHVMTFVGWLMCPILSLFPLLDLRGKFTYDELRFFCSPLLTYGSFRYCFSSVLILTSLPPILFCYVEILRKIKTSKNKFLKREGQKKKKKKKKKRRRRETHLIRANVCFITPYGAVVLLFLLVTTANLDMKTIPEWMHGLTLHLAMSCSTVNS